MMPWNRKELWMGISQEKFAVIKNLLLKEGIPYDFNVRSTSWSGGRGFSREVASQMRYAENVSAQNTYYIYVRKHECEKAAHLIEQLDKSAR